ncbi:MAG: hypothetical protein KGJ06_05330, partial [Pseudomonadota bacterium]|nr:hypothetical protein [Pseudomonadota bacterium]
MNKRLLPFLTLLLLPSSLALAQAEDNQAVMQRMDRIEHDVTLLQRQVARGSNAPVVGDNNAASIPAGGSAQLEVRLSAIEDALRDLRGKVEENDFQVKKISENLEKLQKDTDFRLSELGKPAAAAAPSPEAKNEATAPAPTPTDKGTPKQEGQTSGGDGVLRLPVNDNKNKNFATPREHYNYAFRLLNQTQYEDAAAAFDAFTKKYPKDPL